MGLVHPRPAMRAKEARIIQARLLFYDKRITELKSTGMTQMEASAIAFKEAKALAFTRDGKVKTWEAKLKQEN